jgi:MAF protein
MLESKTNMQEQMLILASNSPRRKHLIRLLGFPFKAQPSDIDETRLPGEQPLAYVRRLALQKGCALNADSNNIIIAADTVVVFEDQVLGKPQDQTEARQILTLLRGKTHKVITAIAVFDTKNEIVEQDLCETLVPMRFYLDEEIEAYIATGDPMDKAGAYAIQHPGFNPVTKLTGCYASVMGLLLCHIARTLRKLDVHTKADLPFACQKELHYLCPVYSAILNDGDKSRETK